MTPVADRRAARRRHDHGPARRVSRGIRAALPAAARIRRRVRGDDGNRGDLERRAGVQGAHAAQRRRHARRGWSRSSPTFFLGVSYPGASVRRDADDRGDRAVAARSSRLRRRHRRTTRCSTRRSRSSCSRPIRRSRIFRGSPAFSRTTSSCRASSRRAAIGSRSRTASSALALVAMLLVWLFNGDTNALIPLYAIGVFVCFTLSQAGMVMHWLRTKEQGWRWRATLNGVGAFATGIVSIIQIVTKFAAGAWIVALIIPLFIAAAAVDPHALSPVRDRHRVPRAEPDPAARAHGGGAGGAVNKATAAALVYATTLSRNVRAIHIEVDPEDDAEDRARVGPLGHRRTSSRSSPSPYRSIVRPLVEYVDAPAARDAGRARDGRDSGARAEALVGASAAQQDGAVHPDGVPASSRTSSWSRCRISSGTTTSTRSAVRGGRRRRR